MHIRVNIMKYYYKNDEHTLLFFKINLDEEVQFALENIILFSIAKPNKTEIQKDLAEIMTNIGIITKDKNSYNLEELEFIFERLKEIDTIIINESKD